MKTKFLGIQLGKCQRIAHLISYTVTKANELFRALAWMSAIKLFLARNMIYFWIKPFASQSSPGIFEDSFGVPVPMLEFSKKFYFPSPEYSKTVRCTCSQTGLFRGCSLTQPGNIPDFRAYLSKKNLPAARFDAPTFWILSKCLTSTPPVLINKTTFFCQEQYLIY